MEDKRIEKLIEELKALKVREAIVLAQLEAAVNLTGTGTGRDPPRTTRGIEDDLIQGDRVRITNRVRKPATWPRTAEWEERKERLGTVTRVTAEQIHIITDNGTRTWRAPQNLKRVPTEDSGNK
jgi:hypothetical protein